MLNRLVKGKSRISAPRANKKATTVVVAAPTNALVTGWIKQLRDVTVEVSLEAAIALGATQDAAAVDALGAAVINADLYFDPRVRAAAAESLAKIGNRRAVEALITGVRDPIAEVSQAAIRALGVLADERAVEPLLVAVRNVNGYFLPGTRHAAVQSLSRFSGSAAQEARAVSLATGNN